MGGTTVTKQGETVKGFLGILIIAALISIIFSIDTNAGTWSQTTQEEFAIDTQNAVDISSGDVIINFPNPDGNTILMLNVDEGTGNPQDSSGKGNHGTITGATWTTQGKFGNALEFDGVNDMVNCGNDESLNITDRITVEAWIKPGTKGTIAVRPPFSQELLIKMA